VDESRVIELAAKGLTQREIAVTLGITIDSLSRRFAEAYKKGVELCNSALRSKQVKLALAGNVTLLIWLGKQRLGQTETLPMLGTPL